MSLVADALQPFIVKELISLAGRTQALTLADIIISEAAAYDLFFDDSDQSITMDFREPNFVVGAFAYDCCVFRLLRFKPFLRCRRK
jgi:hypothetical protein